MNYYTGDDAHKRYSLFMTIDQSGKLGTARRVGHDRESYRSFLRTLPAGSPVAVEATGNWYWMIDEMEKAGLVPSLVHAGKAKAMMGKINKTDKLDARGLAILSLNGTLPTVWIPPGELRDQRELPRMRMVLTGVRTKFKNRIHATFGKYGIMFDEISDLFGKKGRQLLESGLGELPPETRRSVEEQLKLLDEVQQSISETERRILEIVKEDPVMKLLRTLPGVGPILAIVIALEVGDITRFPDGEHFAAYVGKVPRVNSSGDKTYYGKVRPDVNRYLKWAFTEAANAIVLQQERWAGRHVVQLYQRVRRYKGHPKAVTAVGRHLAEATYGMLKKNEPYQEPGQRIPVSVSSSQG